MKAAVGNLAGLLFCTGVSQLCGFGLLLILARHLDEASLGVFFFVLTIQSYLVLIVSFGPGQTFIREVAAQPERTDEFVASYLVLVGGVGLGVTLLSLGVLEVAALASEERGFWLWILTGNLAASFNLLPLFDAHHRQARAALVAALVDLLMLTAFVVAAQAGRLDLILAGQLTAGKWVAIALLQLLLFVRTVRSLQWAARRATVWLVFRSGVFVLSAFLLLLAPLNGGVVLVRLWRPTESAKSETALLGLASQMALVHFVLCWQVARIAAPHITGPHGLDRGFIRRLALAVGGVIGALTLAAGAFGAAVVHWFLPTVYSPALPLLFGQLVGSALLAIGLIESFYLHRAQHEWALLSCYIAAGLVYIGVAWWLIPSGGPWGASLGLIAAALVSSGSMAVVLWRRRAVHRGVAHGERHDVSPPVSPPAD